MELLQLNLTQIIKSRAGKKGKWIPDFLLHGLERVIRQDDLNAILRYTYPAKGSAFSAKVLEYLGIDLLVTFPEIVKWSCGNMPSAYLSPYPSETDLPVVFASNHPLGGLDGIALVKVLGERFGDDNIRVMVNDMLMNVTPLAGVFIPTNKYGKKGAKESSRLLNEAMVQGKSIVMFPAGLVSRLHANPKNDEYPVRDLEWKKTFVTKALEFNRKIVPIRFEARNSMRFYKTAKWRKNLGLKINLEQALLPGELVKCRGQRFDITFLPPVDPAAMVAEGMKPTEIAAKIREMIYKS